MSYEIKVTDYVNNKQAIISEEAEKIFEDINNQLLKGNEVVLNFEGVELIITSFLRIAVGKLYSCNDKNKINSELSFSNMDDDDRKILDRVMQRAEQFYSEA